ncbi:MAG: hypothetical protein JXB32_04715 [Deltaproteobacteria bacterium]|nr:hypothetical protein [Deltaproteobacteria bacterium]
MLVPAALPEAGDGRVGLDEVGELVEDEEEAVGAASEPGEEAVPVGEAVVGEERLVEVAAEGTSEVGELEGTWEAGSHVVGARLFLCEALQEGGLADAAAAVDDEELGLGAVPGALQERQLGLAIDEGSDGRYLVE